MQHFGKPTTLLSKTQVISSYMSPSLRESYKSISSIADISDGKEAEQGVQDTSSINHLESKKLNEFDLVYGRELQPPILGYRCQLPDLPTTCVPSTTLDTSLLHIPVYAHLKIYDLKPVRLPEAPSILSALRLQYSENTMLSKSSRELSSTARLSEEDRISALCSARSSMQKSRIRNDERKCRLRQ